MEFFVADAERMFTENGKLQHLSYWSYKVLTRSFLDSYQNPPLFPSDSHSENFIKAKDYIDFCTWHRYSDFEWLAAQMELDFPGILFPPIPQKDADGTVDKFTELLSSSREDESASKECPLVRRRMRRLQMTLDVVAQLHEIHESPLLKAFATLDERGWCAFREERRMKKKTSILSAVKTKGFIFLSKLKSFGESNTPTHPSSSPLGSIAAQQSELVELLNACFTQIEHLAKYSTSELRNWSDVDALCKPTQGSPLPWTACYNGHLVRHRNQMDLEGLVRSVDDDDDRVLVEWNGQEGKLVRVRLDELSYPSSGVSDPAVFAFQELTSQIESYCMYLSRRPDAVALKGIEDTLWFLSRYAARCVNAISNLKEVETQVESLVKASEKKLVPEQTKRLECLRKNFYLGTSRLIQQYNGFYRSYLKQSLMDIARKFGEITSVLMVDDEWEKRLSRADAILSPRFEEALLQLQSQRTIRTTTENSKNEKEEERENKGM